MNKFNNFNDISQELRESVPALKPGQQVVVRMLNGKYDPITKKYLFGASRNFVLQDRIKDPYSGKIVTIGIADTVSPQGEVTRPKKYRVLADVGVSNGMFTLVGGNVEDEEAYWFFYLCNTRKGNPHRDESVVPTLEFVDQQKEARLKAQTIDDLTRALTAAATLSAQQRREFVAVMNWDLNEDPAVMSARIKEYAKDNPVDFLLKVNDEGASVKVSIKAALDLGVIAYNAADDKILWGESGKTIAILERGEPGQNEIDRFCDWIESKGNGQQTLKTIQGAVKKKQALHAGKTPVKPAPTDPDDIGDLDPDA